MADQKLAVVTGAGRGIGRAAALALAGQGLKLALVARNKTEIEQVAGEINQSGRTALTFPFDLGNLEKIEELAGEIESKLGPVEILVNNAATIGPFGLFWETDPAEWAKVLEINLVSPFRLIRAVLPGMVKRNRGTIINISSSSARSPLERAGAYSTSKAGMDMMTRQLGVELKNTGVTVISFYPGTVDTALQTEIRRQPAEKVGESLATRFKGYYDDGKCLPPELAGGVIATLAGPAGKAFHGQVINISDPEVQALQEKLS